MPHLGPAISNAEHLATEKAVVFVDQHFPGRLIDGFPLRAIVLPGHRRRVPDAGHALR